MQIEVLSVERRQGIWQSMDARWRLAGVLLAVVSVLFLQRLPSAAIAALASLLLVLSTGVPWRWLLGRLAEFAFFLLLLVICLPLTVPGTAMPVGTFTVSTEGLALAWQIALKTISVVSLTLFLFGTGPFEETLHAAQALRVPATLVHLLLLTHRYVWFFWEELARLRIALRVRGFRNRVSGHSYRTLGNVTGALLVSSFARAERVAHAMRLRGFTGRFRSLEHYQTAWRDPALFILLLLGLVGFPWVVELA